MILKLLKMIDRTFFKSLWFLTNKKMKLKNPKFIKIETTNFCNATCKYCPHSKLVRKKAVIDWDLFTKIVDEIIKFNIKEIHLTNFGESLLDPKLFERIEYIKNKKSSIYLKFITNGFLLNDSNINKIVNSKIDEVQVSFDGFSKENFEKYRIPLKYIDIKDKLNNLIRKRGKRKFKIVLNSIYSSDEISTKVIKSFYNRWLKVVDKINLEKIHNWAGDNDKQTPPCIAPFIYMTVFVNGDVVPCCVDYSGKIILGNVSTETLKEIWDSKKYDAFRRDALLLNKKNPLCKNCDVPLNHIGTYYSILKYKFIKGK